MTNVNCRDIRRTASGGISGSGANIVEPTVIPEAQLYAAATACPIESSVAKFNSETGPGRAKKWPCT
jgi:hypothetical protein